MENDKEPHPVIFNMYGTGIVIGYILGRGTLPNMLRVEGRRIFGRKGSEDGANVDFEQIADNGVDESCLLGIWEVMEINFSQVFKLLELERSIVDHAKSFEAWAGKSG